MKQRLWKAIFLVAIGISVISGLFVAFSPVTAAHAAPARAAINCPGQTFSLGATWFGGTTAADITTCSGNELRLIYQTDGNLVLYCGGFAIWATGTNWGNSGYAIF